MNLAEQLASTGHIDMVLEAMARRALFFSLDGKLYAACPEPPVWWVHELRPGSEDYAVTADRCTCPAAKPCKHILMLRGVNDNRRPLQRGER